ncbi:MinD/ParA family ATP-binding protein [Deinococcus yavapaiensis]|uniref:MinD-like ATPase involved in chromosome partitioning or flagellar assembly n=1 Tax=Deinococcus yavapaiensis KR-236 TaxID=694435 RepID=A0A318SBW2_9DEIO|nr:hypothetical protein [Deinococcus yavapaiensis]PYE54784.1 MinD-like ATPase involved in chromosome partitioning or flagellar assembly [Deinococcus yavapaiensis KR-236]
MTSRVPPTLVLHSFVRGSGKTTLAARLAVLASRGARVALIEADLGAPSLQTLLHLDAPRFYLNDFLVGACRAADIMTPLQVVRSGTLFVGCVNDHPTEVARTARTRLSVEQLDRALSELRAELELDLIVLDAAAGLGEQSLPAIALADDLLLVMRLDQQDYQGTGVTADVARKLGVPSVRLLVNMVLPSYDERAIEARVSGTYDADTLVVPYAETPDTLDAALANLWVRLAPTLGRRERAE